MGKQAKSDKEKVAERRRSMKQTGGGPAPNFMFKNWENLVNTYKKFL